VQIRLAIAAAVVLAVLAVTLAEVEVGAEPLSTVPRLKCRAFPTDPNAEVDTRDGSTDLGRWVVALEDEGWVVSDVDWEVGQKPTGYPQGYTHVCLTPAR
jgi:hypothetical protein